MKLVSVNAIFLASCNISLFAKAWLESGHYPPITLFLLSFIFIDLILLLEYEHRQFSKTEVNISESSSLFRRYLFLFAAGAFLTILHKFDLDHYSQYLVTYVLLGQDVYYSLLYYLLNFALGNSYLYLFKQAYLRANRQIIPTVFAHERMAEQICTICLNKIQPKQKVAKINCMHIFHSSCLHKWIKQKLNCPICQTSIQI